MIRLIIIVSLFVVAGTCKTNPDKPIRKVEIVNPDYGILSVEERTRAGHRPLMWRCFPIKDVEVKYRTWRDADPLGPYDVIVTMCDFEIWVNSKPFQNVYHGRRGLQITGDTNINLLRKLRTS